MLINIPNPEGPLPPLPDPIPQPTPQPSFPVIPWPPRERLPEFPISWPPWPRFRSLRGGCYLTRFTPNASLPFIHYDGTMRVERAGTNTIASGDLYLHNTFTFPTFPWWSPRSIVESNPANGIPIFPRSRYRYYLRVTQILEWLTTANSFTLGFERHRFNQTTNSWTNEGTFTALMTWTTAPAGYPSSDDYLTGEVKNSSGAVIGRLIMGWVSPFLRRAVIEVDRVAVAEYPADNGDGVDWQDVFNEVDWDITVYESNSTLNEPSGASWSDAELHAEMLTRRDSANLDTEWRYHLLCVRRLDSTSRGIMYDAFGGDSNNIPREGAAISSHWVIPNSTTWGQVRNMRFGAATTPYFRTAVHELGHAMGLYHNTSNNGFMNTTGVIANNAAPGTFPNNVLWTFAPDDAKRLRHMPDPWVRPGMISFGQSYNTTPISPDDMVIKGEGLELKAQSLLEVVPIGAPVRIDLELANTSNQPLPVPQSLSLKSGHVKGKVIDPSGTVRTFWPLVRCIEEHELHSLGAQDILCHSLTLLRGPQGALFPSPGTYQIIVEITWDINGFEVGVTSSTTLMVSAPVNNAHAKAALKILTTPDALLTLAIGGDHLSDGIAAIQAGLDDPVLHPHFAVIEAKRIGKRFGQRRADLDAAFALLSEDTVLSGSEVKRIAELIQKTKKADRQAQVVKQVIETLHAKVAQVQTDSAIENMVKKL